MHGVEEQAAAIEADVSRRKPLLGRGQQGEVANLEEFSADVELMLNSRVRDIM